MNDSKLFIFNTFSDQLGKKIKNTIEKSFQTDKPIICFYSACFENVFLNSPVRETLNISRITFYNVEKSFDSKKIDLKKYDICFLLPNNKTEVIKTIKRVEVLHETSKTASFSVQLFVHPRKNSLTTRCMEIFLQTPYFKKINAINELNLDFIPLDNDILHFSFGVQEFFVDEESKFAETDAFKSKSLSFYSLLLEALMKFQTVFGKFEFIAAKGIRSETLMNMLKQEDYEAFSNNSIEKTLFPHFLIFDRTSDLITPLISPWTYMSMVSEIEKVKLGGVKIGANLIHTSSETQKSEMANVILRNPNDILLEKIKDNYFPKASKQIQDSLKTLEDFKKMKFDLSDNEKAQKIIEIRLLKEFISIHVDFLKRIEEYVQNPFVLEMIKFEQEILFNESVDFIEKLIELIQVRIPFKMCLKLLILTNFCLKGFPQHKFEQISNEIILSYGPLSFLTLNEMEIQGFFVNKNERLRNTSLIGLNDLKQYKDNFEIINEKMNPNDPLDLYVPYSGYIPISIKLVENLISRNKNIPIVKYKFSEDTSRSDFKLEGPVCICFIGGVTYAEIACLRKLGTKHNRQFLFLTTEILDSFSFSNGLMFGNDFE